MNRKQRPHDLVCKSYWEDSLKSCSRVSLATRGESHGVNEKRTTCEGGCMTSPTYYSLSYNHVYQRYIHTYTRVGFVKKTVRGDTENASYIINITLARLGIFYISNNTPTSNTRCFNRFIRFGAK